MCGLQWLGLYWLFHRLEMLRRDHGFSDECFGFIGISSLVASG
jgi:hypothetical protein